MWENIRGPRPGFWKSKLIARLTYHHIYIRTCRICKAYLHLADWKRWLSTKLDNAFKESRLFKTLDFTKVWRMLRNSDVCGSWCLIPPSCFLLRLSHLESEKRIQIVPSICQQHEPSHWPRQTMWPADNWHLIGHWSVVYASFVGYKEMNLKA